MWFAYRASDSMEADSAVLSLLANGFCSLLPSCGSFHSQGHQADTEQAGPPGSPAAEGTRVEAGVRVSCRDRSRRGTINNTGNLVLTTHRRECSDVLHPLPTAPPSQTAVPLHLRPYWPKRLQRAFLALASQANEK